MPFSLLPKSSTGCPYLILAPMEGVGDKSFRKALNTIGGFDEAVTEFISVPFGAHVKSLAKVYDCAEISPTPLAAQIMGADPDLMAAMAQELEKRGACRIDINCGCPSNTVTGRGAGSSLLKDPSFLYEIANTVVNAVTVPVTIKMRSGFEDTTLFQENLLAAEQSGAKFITLHPRTKIEGYGPPARWDLIAKAKTLLKIPVVGNGDILCVQDAINILSQTNCDALMIGRGAIINPFLFHEIRTYFSLKQPFLSWDTLHSYLSYYLQEISTDLSEKGQIGKLKQLASFLFRSNEQLTSLRPEILKSQIKKPEELLQAMLLLLKKHFFSKKNKNPCE